MSLIGFEAAGIPAGLTAKRAGRWALMQTRRDLRLSIVRGRPISLPNLLRLYRRRTAQLSVPPVDAGRLRELYLRQQPFAPV